MGTDALAVGLSYLFIKQGAQIQTAGVRRDRVVCVCADLTFSRRGS